MNVCSTDIAPWPGHCVVGNSEKVVVKQWNRVKRLWKGEKKKKKTVNCSSFLLENEHKPAADIG